MARVFNTDADLAAQNYALFKDCFATRVLLALAPSSSEDTSDADELDEFISFLAADAWATLPISIHGLSYKSDEATLTLLDDSSTLFSSLDPGLVENLVAYGIPPVEDADAPLEAAESFLRAVLDAYVPLARTPPPVWKSTRTTECEICTRAVPLTYHHLVPRGAHARALKRGWHEEDVLNSVAWLCRRVLCI